MADGLAAPVKLFGKWSLDDVEISDLSLVVSLIELKEMMEPYQSFL